MFFSMSRSMRTGVVVAAVTTAAALLPPTSLHLRAGKPLRFCAAPPAAAARDDFLISNKYNQVQTRRCANQLQLQEGAAEWAAVPHICVAGMSNAGKSSLVNHLLVKGPGLARTSSVSGKTRTVDLLRVNQRVVLTDFPGLPAHDNQHWYAWQSEWLPLIQQYVCNCKALRAMLYLHDVRWQVTKQMVEFLEGVQAEGLPVLLLLTKDDKLTDHSHRMRCTNKVLRSLQGSWQGLHLHYCSRNDVPAGRKGRRQLLRLIETIAITNDQQEARQVLEALVQKRQQQPTN